jgi:spore maturation protein CgeB
MRSFEAAAIGGCILTEGTTDHRELFGPDDHAVRYFRTPAETVQHSRFLLDDAGTRRRLSTRLRERLVAGKHTYADRLATMAFVGLVRVHPRASGGHPVSRILQRGNLQEC